MKAHEETVNTDINQADRLINYGATITEISKRCLVQRWPEDFVRIPEIRVGEKVAVVIGKEKLGSDPEGCARLLHEIDFRTTDAQVTEKTIKNIATRCVFNTLSNVMRLPGKVFASHLTEPLRGIPAFVVCAGPSLDKNIHLLPEAARYGVIIATNTAARALLKAGVPIDILVIIESLDVSDKIYAGYGGDKIPIAVIDTTAHPLNWQAVERITSAIVPVVNNDPAFNEPVLTLGGTPLSYGGTVSSAAVSVARYWNAEAIYLLGQDLAWTDFRGYAKNTLDENITCDLAGDNLRFTGVPRKEGQLLTWALVPAWDGKGQVYTTADLLSFVPWFSKLPKARAPFTRGVINCTEGGARIPNLLHVPLEQMLDTYRKAPPAVIYPRRVMLEAVRACQARPTAEQARRYMASVISRAVRVSWAAQSYRYCRGVSRYMDWRLALDALPMVHGLTATSVFKSRDAANLGMRERFNIIVEAGIGGINEMLGYIEGLDL